MIVTNTGDPALTFAPEYQRREIAAIKRPTAVLSYNQLMAGLRLGHSDPAFFMCAYEAVMIDPLNLDALYVMCFEFHNACFELARELLAFARPQYEPLFAKEDDVSQLLLGPYVRLLGRIGAGGLVWSGIDTTVLAFEEILRIRTAKRESVEEALLCVYLRKIGEQRNLPSPIVRTWQHVEELAKRVRSGSSMHSLAKILRMYDVGDGEWKDLAKESISPRDVEACLNWGPDLLFTNLLACALVGWNDFIADVMILLGYEPGAVLDVINRRPAAQTQQACSNAARVGTLKMSEIHDLIAQGDWNKAYNELFMAMLSYRRASLTTDVGRWYLNAPPMLFECMAKVFMKMEVRFPLKYALRIGIAIDPTNSLWYEMIPQFYVLLDAPPPQFITDICAQAKKEIEAGGDCRQVAKQAIAALLFEVVIGVGLGLEVTPERWSALVRIGMEDQFTPIGAPPTVLDPLPWLIGAPTEYDI